MACYGDSFTFFYPAGRDNIYIYIYITKSISASWKETGKRIRQLHI
jgi:hypothetical protein